jgi:hypothetical protein
MGGREFLDEQDGGVVGPEGRLVMIWSQRAASSPRSERM